MTFTEAIEKLLEGIYKHKSRTIRWLKSPLSCKMGHHVKSSGEWGHNMQTGMVDFFCSLCGKKFLTVPLDDAGFDIAKQSTEIRNRLGGVGRC